LRKLQLFDGRPQLSLQEIELGLRPMLLQALAAAAKVLACRPYSL
jgi:hypothetical protein